MSRLLLAFLVSTSLALPAAADDTVTPWGTVANWTIAVDGSLNNGCFMTSGFGDGTAIRVGFNPSNNKQPFYIAISNVNWASIESGKQYPVRLEFSRNASWNATAVGAEFDEGKGLWIGFHQTDFIVQFARKSSIGLYFQNQRIAHLSLRSSARASRQLVRCQLAANNMLGGGTDPFAGASGGGADPFE